MTSLQLPPPRKVTTTSLVPRSTKKAAATAQSKPKAPPSATTKPAAAVSVPSYEERCRSAATAASLPKEERPKLFVPRRTADFGDGGAFPEIHVAQYPRQMGNPHLKGANNSKALVSVEVDKEGKVSYDAIVKRGTNSDKLVYSKLSDMKASQANEEDIALPSEDEVAQETARTQAALQALLGKKTALDKASGSAIQASNVSRESQFIQYTARPDAPGYNPSAAKRIIQMIPAQVDPMMPPKHKHVKAPRGPAEDPVPILHEPPRKLTAEERDAWNVPACISNWKNSRGYTIPLDKRLAADGRGLVEAEVNSSNFAQLSESLYVAEQQARQEVRLRAQTLKQQARSDTDAREAELRALAQQARLERGGDGGGGGAAAAPATATEESSLSGERVETVPEDGSDDDDTAEDAAAAAQREKLRVARKRERERELRLEHNVEAKKKQRLEEERDVSEKIALGVHTGTGGGGGAEDNVDSRLYNQSAGMDSGFGADDEYTAYTKPLFESASAATGASLYRPTRGETEYNADEQYDKLRDGATTKFQPHKGFGGAEGGAGHSAGPRSAPVQFEKSKPK